MSLQFIFLNYLETNLKSYKNLSLNNLACDYTKPKLNLSPCNFFRALIKNIKQSLAFFFTIKDKAGLVTYHFIYLQVLPMPVFKEIVIIILVFQNIMKKEKKQNHIVSDNVYVL